MNVDYLALLSRAVSGKDAAARQTIYKDAWSLIRRSHLSREDIASHTAALEDAIRRIEDEFAADEAASAEEISEVLATPDRNWKPLIVGVSALVAALALAALTYGWLASQTPRTVTAEVKAPPQKVARRDDAVAADLKPGVDGGSTGDGLPFAFQRQVVFYRTSAAPGSIVIDRENRYLYLIDVNNSARRYGIGIAQECQKGGSLFRITNKMEWPDWKPPAADAKGGDAQLMPTGRPGSPLGARALLLDKPGLLIHGTNSPKTIGHLVASGCIRLVNDDVEDLYRRVSVETRVVFVS